MCFFYVVDSSLWKGTGSIVVADSSPSEATVGAGVPGLIVVPPAALICRLSATIRNTRAFNSLFFAEIKFVCVVTMSSVLAWAAFLDVLSIAKSVKRQPGDNVLGSRLAKTVTISIAFSRS